MNNELRSEILARKQAESEFSRMFNATPDMMALGGFDGYFKRVNPAMLQTLGYSQEELLATPFRDLAHPDDLDALGAQAANRRKGEKNRNLHYRVRHKDGHYLHTEWTDVPFMEGGVLITMGRDITQEKEVKSQLVDANQYLKAEVAARTLAQLDLEHLFTNSHDLLCLGGYDGIIRRVNAAFCTAFGYCAEELIGRSFMELVSQEDVATVSAHMAKSSVGGQIGSIIVRTLTKDGAARTTQWDIVPFVDRGIFYATGRDITERMQLEGSLRRMLDTLNDAQRLGKVGSWEVDLVTGTSRWSDEIFRICGFSPGEVTPHIDLFYSLVHPDDIERVRREVAGEGPGMPSFLLEYRLVLRDGSVRYVEANSEFVRAPDGKPLLLRGTCHDVTERKAAGQRQLKLEAQLRSAQKMEAVGSLAGGIAHDFNNLLSVILSYTGFVIDALPQGDPRRDDLAEVQKAAERAAALTHQLLAFGRRQVLQPVALSLNTVTSGMENMLHRIIGEDVTLNERLDPELGFTMADPGQIEQVIMNLVVNSRDAMPLGGVLVIETKNVDVEAPGDKDLPGGSYVVLSVTDSGTGMDAEMQKRVFEPFFTTKEVGKGTGLGLSTAFGIVKQSGGHLTLYSEPGLGSTFRVYLPRVQTAPALAVSMPSGIFRGTETILVVEDEPAVRGSAKRILEAAGYHVLTAVDGQDGLRVAKDHSGMIDLAVTDVVMPRMSGAAFARQMAMQDPQTRILFMSGYAGDVIMHHGRLDPGTQFIGKPFNATELTRKVRSVLEADRDEYPTDPTDFAPPTKGRS